MSGDDLAVGISVLQNGLLESFCCRQHYCKPQAESPYKETRCFLTCFITFFSPLLVHPSYASGMGRAMGRKKIWILAMSLLCDPDRPFTFLGLSLLSLCNMRYKTGRFLSSQFYLDIFTNYKCIYITFIYLSIYLDIYLLLPFSAHCFTFSTPKVIWPL